MLFRPERLTKVEGDETDERTRKRTRPRRRGPLRRAGARRSRLARRARQRRRARRRCSDEREPAVAAGLARWWARPAGRSTTAARKPAHRRTAKEHPGQGG